jgi:hypothetical protein
MITSSHDVFIGKPCGDFCWSLFAGRRPPAADRRAAER